MPATVITDAQLRHDNGSLWNGPLDKAWELFLNDARWWKISFRLPNDEQVRFVRRAGVIVPTVWSAEAHDWVQKVPADIPA